MLASLLLLTCLLLGFVTGCRTAPSQREANARFFEQLVPGARIGAPAAPIASHHHLPVVDYVGYGDSTASPREGIRGVFLFVEPTRGRADGKPAADGLISRISLTIEASTVVRDLVDDLNREFGAPSRYCYTRGDEVQFDVQYWPQEARRGVLASRRAGVDAPVTFTMPSPEPDSVRSAPGACAG